MAKETIRKDTRVSTEATPKTNFAFDRKNYTLLLVGIVTLIIGFVALSGGGSTDPNVFNNELFSPRRMVFAPIVLILGYGIVAYAIMIRPKPEAGTEETQE